MADQAKVKKLHDSMPAVYNTRVNPNWKAFIEAAGNSDQEVADLIENVRKQFFVKTASRPYIDRLGSVNNVQRPKFVGMDDTTFREFIPIMSYNPKQVKLVLYKLLDLFFFKDSTKSFTQTTEFEPFVLSDGWTLKYLVDGINSELIQFSADAFSDVNAATADEVVSNINRQSKYSYAISYEDSISKQTYIRIFTNTIGSKGSINIKGGLVDVGLKFDGFNYDAGNGNDTEWEVSVIGDTVKFQYASGEDPGLNNVNIGDIALIDIENNVGSNKIMDVNIGENYFTFTNLFGTPGVYQQTSSNQLKFIADFAKNVYTQNRRALTWEIKPGEIIVEIPPSPPVVKRQRKGAAHINGVVGLVINVPSSTELELKDASKFPEDGGKLMLEKVEEIKTEIAVGNQVNYKFKGRLIGRDQVYTYTGVVGNKLVGIVPDLPYVSSLDKHAVLSASRLSDILTVETSVPHGFATEEYAIISESSSYNSASRIIEIISDTVFTCDSPGLDASYLDGNVRVERIGLSNEDTKVILKSSKLEPKMPGPYLWDKKTDFLLSSYTTNLITEINAGTTNRNVIVEENDLPSEEGQIVFDFGTERQEGPIRYFYKPSSQSIAIDPAYVFKFTHDVGSAVTKINKKGGIQFKGDGTERAPYITDPAAAREILKELMEQVKSIGIFLNFMVRYPELYYGTVDVYRSEETSS